MRHQSLLLFFILIIISGCTKDFDDHESLPQVVAHEINIKSASFSSGNSAGLSADLLRNLNLWVYACDGNGNVTSSAPVYHQFIDLTQSGQSSSVSTTLEFPRETRYYRLVAMSNYDRIFSSTIAFKQLTTAKVTSVPTMTRSSHWAIMDTRQRDEDGVSRTPIRLFPIPGKVTFQVAKATDAMRVLVKHVQVRSAHAPKEGFVLSAMTREQIEDGEFGADTWWHEGVSISYTDDYLNEIASDVTLNSSKVYEAVGSALLYEHKEGCTDLTPFFEDGFVNVPEGDGYYLDLEYRYTTSPTADLLDNTDVDVVCVRKYIPLKPVLRGHHQVIKVMINSNEIIVNGSTEVSEETPGEW